MKGHDFQDNNTIKVDDFFTTLESIPELIVGIEGLKKGDLIDLVNDLDDQRTGFISLELFKGKLMNQQLGAIDPAYAPIYTSNLKQAIHSTIVGNDDDEVQPIQKSSVRVGKRAVKTVQFDDAPSLKKQVDFRPIALDMWCAI